MLRSGQKMPRNVQKMPRNVQKMLRNGQKMPRNVQKMPRNVQKMLRNVQKLLRIVQRRCASRWRLWQTVMALFGSISTTVHGKPFHRKATHKCIKRTVHIWSMPAAGPRSLRVGLGGLWTSFLCNRSTSKPEMCVKFVCLWECQMSGWRNQVICSFKVLVSDPSMWWLRIQNFISLCNKSWGSQDMSRMALCQVVATCRKQESNQFTGSKIFIFGKGTRQNSPLCIKTMPSTMFKLHPFP